MKPLRYWPGSLGFGPIRRRSRLQRLLTMDDFEQRARWLPGGIFDAIAGGDTDETTVWANRAAYSRIWFRPPALAEAGQRDMSTTVLGQRVSMPLLLAPCGSMRMAHPQAELAVARAAGAADTVMVVSQAGSYPFAEIARAATGPLWIMLSPTVDRDAASELMSLAHAAGCRALVVIVDAPGGSKRERDLRNRLSLPFRMTRANMATALCNPYWASRFMWGAAPGYRGYGGVKRSLASLGDLLKGLARYANDDDIRWFRTNWAGKLVIKGILRGDEVDRLLDLGADAFIISNHGGRNFSYVRPTLEILPEVVEAVDGRAEVMIDGGIRRGADVVKALALGARACFIGRPWVYGLAVAGEAGVSRVLEIFRQEIGNTMQLLGCGRVADINRSLIQVGSQLLDHSGPLDQAVQRPRRKSGPRAASG